MVNFEGIDVHLDEMQRQAVLLAIARLSVERPGWDEHLAEIADLLDGRTMFDMFRDLKRAEVPMGDVATRPDGSIEVRMAGPDAGPSG
jgi:hypothetical protein